MFRRDIDPFNQKERRKVIKKTPPMRQINAEKLRNDFQQITLELRRATKAMAQTERDLAEAYRQIEECQLELEDHRAEINNILDLIEEMEGEFCNEEPADDPASEGIRAAREEAAGIIQIVPHPPEVAELTPDQIQDAKQRFSDAEERN